MASVDFKTVNSAMEVLIARNLSMHKTVYSTLRTIGVTEKQWRKYLQSGTKLKCKPVVAAKLELLASMRSKDTSHLPTLLRMIEIKYGEKQ